MHMETVNVGRELFPTLIMSYRYFYMVVLKDRFVFYTDSNY